MVGWIDPRCETLRGTNWPVKVAVMFGTRVAENHLGQRSTTASTGRTYGCKRSDQTFKKTLAARGPSTYGSRRSPGRPNSNLHHLPRLQRYKTLARNFRLLKCCMQRDRRRVDGFIGELKRAVVMRQRLLCAAIGQCLHGV